MPMLPSAAQQFQLEIASSLASPQKYTQHLLSGTPAFHDHAHVGVRSLELQATNPPCFWIGMSGLPLTSDIKSVPNVWTWHFFKKQMVE
jgi:hypothetical protein